MSCRKCAGRTEARKGGQYCERCGYQSGCRTTGERTHTARISENTGTTQGEPDTATATLNTPDAS